MVLGLYWHLYHDRLVDECLSVEKRRKWIRQVKPSGEIGLRLRLMRRVKNQKVGRELLWARTRAANRKLRALHREECVAWCPWRHTQQTIFTATWWSVWEKHRKDKRT